MRTAEIRQRWLDYFASKDHAIVPSVPLISPDPSILFTIAGMVPFIPYILGTQDAPWPRVANAQKCIRTNDIENVGRTTRHGTFFQMLGNFSFGDYFKEGAIELAWGFLTGAQESGGLGLDGDRLWVTIWNEDDEAADALVRVGVDPRHVVRLTREEIFWDTGQPGPAGPCAEWHYDRGPEFGPDAVGGTVDPGGDRYLEIWNLVFDQFVRGEGRGKDYPLLGELERKAIDTGAGLERIAYLLQGKNNLYETDEVFPVIERAAELSGRRYGASGEDDVRLRVVGDHVRSALMLIGDGVTPSNEGRGYVLRRLVRRAVRSMRLLGVEDAALPELLPISRDLMGVSYPEVVRDFDRISQVAYGEEDAFLRTLTAGTTIFEGAVSKAKAGADGTGVVLTGEQAFALHDTYGFPIDLTLEMAAEHGVDVDEQAFRTLMQAQRDRARADALAKKTGHADTSTYQQLQQALSAENGASVRFVGYTDTTAATKVVGLLVDGVPAPAATAPADVQVVLDVTPFYAEAGGQLADTGTISLADGAIVEVDDVQAPIKGLSVHHGRLVDGTLTLGDTGTATIDTARRRAIARAHTATHMVHKALREELGDTATQAGSENAPSRLRFDFRSGQSVPASSLSQIEGRVNERLQDDLEVTDRTMAIDEARALGAMALFGEKYGNEVRVVSIGGDWSRELCAGTHVRRSGELGLVTLLGESSIGSGVRRVDALVGDSAYGYQAKERALVSQLSGLLGARPDELGERVSSLLTRVRESEKELAALRQAQVLAAASGLAAGAQQVGTALVVAHDAGEVAAADDLRTLALDVRGRLGESSPVVVAVGGVAKGRPVVVVVTNAAAREAGHRAGALVRTASGVLGGGGGGKDDVAQGGGTDASRLPDALDGVVAAVRG
ncbi:alanyl-tRNA synthetase [Cellulomonas flavigena DSM 20109]|uniref:Alanine--tRNA ligase n=1 Tax=Cellulomonas flavigena (strain ATCC 482 / DSM 20109 / BCRC 11376 / JCM 18109 / NBRC 3775 / NCIMB 8073 / NRS 134) TaxID=446466 RepID=D5UEQ5_CELFN|nr:alanine--tRNA ligase [Cellulomonas flavigena]ADG74715.1 alanyl-tRNA synthetase [Cellulomonas flavigena DSM 20109]